MQINALNYSYTAPKISFQTNDIEHYDSKKEIEYRNTTSMFRSDLRWSKVARVLEKTFSDKNQVKIYDYACSDGSEPYSLAMILSEYTRDNKKFFPIIAKDFDENIIKKAKSGFINFKPMDFRAFERVKIKSEKYFNDTHKKEIYEDEFGFENKFSIMEIKEDLKNKVKFEVADIFEDCKKIDFEKPNVVLFRNVWRYFEKEDREKLVTHFAQNMKPKSLLILGDFDFGAFELRGLLSKNYFKDLGSNIYQKVGYSLYTLDKDQISMQ